MYTVIIKRKVTYQNFSIYNIIGLDHLLIIFKCVLQSLLTLLCFLLFRGTPCITSQSTLISVPIYKYATFIEVWVEKSQSCCCSSSEVLMGINCRWNLLALEIHSKLKSLWIETSLVDLSEAGALYDVNKRNLVLFVCYL